MDRDLKLLFEHLPPDKEPSAPALAFLAKVVKDHSAIDPAIALMSTACKLKQDNACYALNLAHTLELECRFDEAIDAVISFCKSNPTLAVRSLDGKVI